MYDQVILLGATVNIVVVVVMVTVATLARGSGNRTGRVYECLNNRRIEKVLKPSKFRR